MFVDDGIIPGNFTRLCAETLAAQDIAVTVCEKDGAKALAAFRRKAGCRLLDAFMLA
ncbi:MAG: hypothetical protein ACLRZH_07735 [Ruthenibacterium lactatiformans]